MSITTEDFNMKDFTLLIQGRLSNKTINFYKQNNPGCEVLISTWNNNPIDLSNLPENFRVINSEIPNPLCRDGRRYKIVSTLNGLKNVRTSLVIVIRGDCHYSNLEYIAEEILIDSNKIYVSPLTFRHHSVRKFHIGDYIIGGRTDQLHIMFEAADELALEHFSERYCNEQVLTLAYLSKKYPNVDFFQKDKLLETPTWDPYVDNTLDVANGIQYMIESFEIIDIRQLHPYLMLANHLGKGFTHFIPEREYGTISRISMLLSTSDQYQGIIGTSWGRRSYNEEPYGLTGREHDPSYE